MQEVAPEAQGTKKLWGGRFTGQTDPLMEKFNESLPFDRRMWREDIRASSPCTAPVLQLVCNTFSMAVLQLGSVCSLCIHCSMQHLAGTPCCAFCRAARHMQRPWRRLAC